MLSFAKHSSLHREVLKLRSPFLLLERYGCSGISDVRDFVRGKLPKDSDTELEYVDKLYISNVTNEKCYYGVIMLTHR